MEYEEVENRLQFNVEDWKGKNRFLCKGHLITGPSNDNVSVLCSHFCLITWTVLFEIGIVPQIEKEVWGMVGIANIALFLGSYISLLITEWSDPGILLKGDPFATKPPSPDQVSQDKEAKIQMDNNAVRPVRIETYRWCETCFIWRPPYSSHCGSCDNCVKGFDHHCTFANNCIGARNVKYFLLCLLLVSLNNILMLFFSISFCWMGVNLNYEIAERYDTLLYLSIAVIIVGAYIKLNNLTGPMKNAIPLAIGIIMLYIYYGLVVNFSPIPLVLVVFLLAISPWIWATTYTYTSLACRGMTMKMQVAYTSEGELSRIGHCHILNFIKFFFRRAPPSELKLS